jgi:hypothetical protein
MENHPIPQDITGFQFKLIGDMTVRQFAYLAAGSIFGWIIFSLPVTAVVKLPIASLSILLGVSFAFFSIQGRPMDTMISNFIKALFSPTQYVYQRTTHVKIETPKMPEPEQPKVIETKLHVMEDTNFQAAPQVMPVANSQPQLQVAQPVQHPLPQEEVKVEELEQEEEKIKQELEKAKEEEVRLDDKESAHQKTLELEKILNETVSQKQKLEEELFTLRKQVEESGKQVFSVPQPLSESQTVRSVPPSLGKTVGLPIAPEYPNVISGIIKDPRGNPLQNILVEVKDQEGNPVRAFKTNPLGQFTASTPLTNGVYRIEFEDPLNKNKFEVIEFEATGNIIYPLEIVSVDTREELRQSLFK